VLCSKFAIFSLPFFHHTIFFPNWNSNHFQHCILNPCKEHPVMMSEKAVHPMIIVRGLSAWVNP
ncbi:MAG: hypothetical protein MR828_00775, partial [Clostridiales bacterium]|nr:hypothetical protein [Clostridiales bacterium]